MPDATVGWPAIILPVRNGGELLGPALAGFVPAAAAAGGRLVVIDDASQDHTATAAREAGAEVISLNAPSGPYVARNEGWRWADKAGAGVAVFVDVRCRPRSGWLVHLLDALRAEGVAMAAGEVAVLPRTHTAGRAAAILEPLSLRHGRQATFLPYAPTCHLAVPISMLKAVDGFRAVRGGGDVDLCWRLQEGGFGTIGWAEDAVLDWEPRARVMDLLAQHRRYGANSARLHHSHRRQGFPAPKVAPRWRIAAHHARVALSQGARTRPGDWAAVGVAELARAVQELSYVQTAAHSDEPEQRP